MSQTNSEFLNCGIHIDPFIVSAPPIDSYKTAEFSTLEHP